jgi:hypothetical protein
MKKVVFILVSLSIISCSTTKSSTSKTIDIVGAGVIHKPIVADLEVNPTKTSKTVELRNVLSLDNAKNEVVSELLKEKSADLLVEPTFESKTKNGKTELTVYGWTASYKNFRPIEEKDIKFLEVKPNLLQKANTYEPIIEKKKKNTGLWVTLVVLAAGGIVLGSTL